MNDVQFIRSRDRITGVCRMSLTGFTTCPRCGVCLWSPFTIMSVPGVFGSEYTVNKQLGRKKRCVVGAALWSWDMGMVLGPTLPLSWVSRPVGATCPFSEST
jgi:hypothetical protein